MRQLKKEHSHIYPVFVDTQNSGHRVRRESFVLRGDIYLYIHIYMFMSLVCIYKYICVCHWCICISMYAYIHAYISIYAWYKYPGRSFGVTFWWVFIFCVFFAAAFLTNIFFCSSKCFLAACVTREIFPVLI